MIRLTDLRWQAAYAFPMRGHFSRRTDYALRAAIELAGNDTGLTKRHAIAVATDAPPSVMATVLSDLVRAGIAVAVAGRNGGYRLARHANEISILDVVDAVEGPPEEARCVLHDRACSWAGACPLHPAVAEAEAAVPPTAGRRDAGRRQ